MNILRTTLRAAAIAAVAVLFAQASSADDAIVKNTLSKSGPKSGPAVDAPAEADLVEKPKLEEAPSDLAIAGRYLLSADIFGLLATQTPGHGGEIQLTDAIRRLLATQAVFGYVYPGQRQDIGNPQGYLKALEAFNGIV